MVRIIKNEDFDDKDDFMNAISIAMGREPEPRGKLYKLWREKRDAFNKKLESEYGGSGI